MGNNTGTSGYRTLPYNAVGAISLTASLTTLYHDMDPEHSVVSRFQCISNVCFVCLTVFIQANVMLEYNLDDAEKLLQKNLEAATSSLSQVEDDLSFIRDQTTTVEVSILGLQRFCACM